jgi:hypothetical protein
MNTSSIFYEVNERKRKKGENNGEFLRANLRDPLDQNKDFTLGVESQPSPLSPFLPVLSDV